MAHSHKDEISFTIVQNDFGRALVAQSAKGLKAILLGTNDNDLVTNLRKRFPNRPLTRHSDFPLATTVVSLLENPAGVFPHPLDSQGGDFEQLIWAAVRNIPLGKTKSAAAIAREIMAAPSAKETVLKICRDSNFAVVIPTHRVAEMDGSGSGFAWDEGTQRALLAREAHQ